MADRLGLFEYLTFCLDAVTPVERHRAQWVMNPEWHIECRSLSDAGGRPLWLHSELLFGLPVDVRDNGGAPHLEPAR